ncbi:MAG: antibiotic biosynthesis monooxygenase [Deltaproteobacteria bacterium]|nr:antibiotic biosynthesis monooxygenase [Deltaproteobacteria bacterium]
MAVKVMIQRIVPPEREQELLALTMKLRVKASRQPGYISGETLRSVNDPSVSLVVSTWQTLEDWNEWVNSKDRQEIQRKIDTLLERKTLYETYFHPNALSRTSQDSIMGLGAP